ncbi:MAG: FdtA/QdtA family cupin domain-containing protein [Actinobacteria bacterium]|nr:FdtA/QdtA family cupin domain-containing protein [Actinomycetota bacterium]
MNRNGQEPTLGTFPIFSDPRGALGAAEFGFLPFQPRRMFWIYDVAPDETRANHGHRECEQVVFVQTGSVTGFTLDAAGARFDFALAPGEWVYVPVRHWLQINTFPPNSVVGVLASHPFDADEYIDSPDELDS